jgi:hypothetical protein
MRRYFDIGLFRMTKQRSLESYLKATCCVKPIASNEPLMLYAKAGILWTWRSRRHLSPLGWEHINLTGDYQWRNTAKLGKSKFRPLRQP